MKTNKKIDFNWNMILKLRSNLASIEISKGDDMHATGFTCV